MPKSIKIGQKHTFLTKIRYFKKVIKMKSEYVIKIKLDNCSVDINNFIEKINNIFEIYNKDVVEHGFDSFCIKYKTTYKDNRDKITKKYDKTINKLLKELK
jgi:hypothetical protein